MTLERFFVERGRVIESPTDPASVTSNRINAESLWLDTSYSPPRLRERNSGNTAWNILNPFSGVITINVTATPNGESSWSDTVSDPDIKATSKVELTPNQNGTNRGLVANLTNVVDGSFGWDMGSYSLVPPSSTLYIHYSVSP